MTDSYEKSQVWLFNCNESNNLTGAAQVPQYTTLATGPAYTPPKIASDYECLKLVLDKAYEQAATGKGSERHANGLAFEDQPMQDLIKLYGIGFALGQAGKKMQESQRMVKHAQVRELLGAIVYIAGAIIAIEKKDKE